MTGEVESRVVAALAAAGTCSTVELTESLGLTTSSVHATLVRLVQSGLVHAEDGRVGLTPAGHARADELGGTAGVAAPGTGDRAASGVPGTTIDLAEIGRAVSALWTSSAGSASVTWSSPQTVAAARRRDALLASDADRDAAVHVLADALSVGRLTSAEFDDRTDRALAARTYGELDAVLEGLGGLPGVTPPGRPWRKGLFWGVSVVSSPFVLFGVLFTAFADQVDEVVFGLVLLVLTLPGLFGLWRWAWPRH